MSNDANNDAEASGLKQAMNKATDAVGGMVGMASASTLGSHDSAAFVMNACVGDLYEVAAGEIAAQRAASEAVRAFGEMMVAHHTTAVHQMQAALSSSEVTRALPELAPTLELDERRSGMLKHLIEAPDDAFDRTYLAQQSASHRESAVLHDGYAAHGDNPQLRSLAASGLPMIQRHMRMLERLGKH